tara:strand:- start:664 stop:1533 length:870 start_codon:yes stop_codon:yes gene_type:complete
MFTNHLISFSDYLIEENTKCQTYLIPGQIFSKVLDWYGMERLKSFKDVSKFSPSFTDLDIRDEHYTHMILWDPEKLQLIGGQRFKFNLNNYNFENSFLEHYHPGIYANLEKKNLPFAEIGRTFIMPNYQCNKDLWFKELIRGFVRIPESKGINLALGLISFNHLDLQENTPGLFLNCLENSFFKGFLEIPFKKILELKELDNIREQLNWDKYHLSDLEKKIIRLDNDFKLPEVLKPYRAFCSVEYEGYSLAENYNKIYQLLFSGQSKNIGKRQRMRLKPYNSMKTWDEN